MQAEAVGHQALVEGAEGLVVRVDGLHRAHPLHVDDLGAPQQQADPLLQLLGPLLQAAVAGQPLHELGRHTETSGWTH